MSKREYILRYLNIIKKLRASREATFEEMDDCLRKESEFHGDNLRISKRTFQRDLNEIRSLFDIDIEYNFSRKTYSISHDAGQTEMSDRMLEAFELYHALNTASHLYKHIFFESRKPQGMEHFYGLLHAIKNRCLVHFSYQKFWEEKATQRSAEPYSLKEFKSRWYIFAKDKNDGRTKIFGLDRISLLQITTQHFSFPKELDVNELFKNCFGIICPDDSKPEEVILSFDAVQGKYIKSFPIHSSQEIVKDKEDECRIKLKLYLTYDFIMELLSYGENVKVISPLKLKKEIRKAYSDALSQYKTDIKR